MNNFVGLSKIGLVRQRNEDRFFIDGPICAVTDGMGGYSGGEIASTYAVDEIRDYLSAIEHVEQKDLCDAVLHANQRIVDHVAHEERLAGMGTTAVVTAIDEDKLYWASVGDSRLYIFRDGVLRQITTDHSMVQELLDSGDITKDEMLTHPQRNLLTRAVGVDENLEVDSGVETVQTGDRILLCTDGLSGYVTDEDIASTLHAIDDNMQAIESLMTAVYDVGAGDNVTIVVGTI
ncbi:Stp1/IreP family PP2C-type Ser/Thr phosphatase [Veillonella sp. AS16]|uniref:Stp1/IreP family PP2C-type Ser/Thr phosphatase n=1 Tax=Veillonella sp. AS16 TaxID=936589 RepID=UPI0003E2A6AE|nr:Stp1/IreP family PP2C-type Ser/Thr phosphatase [Veillonella sp. AS16]ETS93768.1 phosphoprotein phosphatase [Veillonella sp. AS16]